MVTEFERIKQEVNGHSIIVTSWYDDQTQTWGAGAPAYAHVLTSARTTRPGSPSRSAAIEQVVRALAHHFNT